MKPRTKQQWRFYNMSRNLPKITDVQKQWALDNCLRQIAYRTKKITSCLDCGHEWPTVGTDRYCTCPKCDKKLKIEVTRKKKLHQREFLAILDVVEEIQVVRLFEIESNHRIGQKMRVDFQEVIHQFFNEDRVFEVVARQRNLSWNIDSFSGLFEIRDKHQLSNKYDLIPTKVLPGAKVLPVYRRNGFKSSLHGVTAYGFFNAIMVDSRAETLLKAGQRDLFRANISRSSGYLVSRYWDSVKICMRNNYVVKDATTWLDYLELLAYFRKDLRSPKYVCPEDLKHRHDKLVAKKRAEQRRREIESMRRQLENDQTTYAKAKRAFFGIVFQKGDITVKVLETVKEFMEEGDIHKHCLFTNRYFSKKDSLVLSAAVNGKPMETVEVSLSEMKVVQARGLNNEPTEYHYKIISLVNRNMSRIRKVVESQERGVA